MKKQFLSGMTEIPEQERGTFRIQHEKLHKGERVTIVSMRNALFDGRRASYTVLDRDYWKMRLLEDGDTWMTDSPQEIEQARVLVQDFRGKVLVGGLGLGVVLQVLPKQVKRVHVVERSAEVIDMVWKYTRRLGRDTITNDDLWNILPAVEPGAYDFVFLDIWAPTGERALTEFVIPLRRELDGKLPQKNIRCWGESEMWGQVKMALATFVQLPDFFDKMPTETLVASDALKAPFYRWYRETKPTQAKAMRMIDNFVKNFGRIAE